MKSHHRPALAVLLAALALVQFVHSSARSADPQPARAPASAQARVQDIGFFRRAFLAKDRSFGDAARAAAETRLAALEAKAVTVEQPAFELELARIAALADNGHTHYVFHSISRYYNRVPLRLAVFGEDFHVVRAAEGQHDLLGARLVAIDGHPLAELREAVRSLWGGPAPLRDRYAFELLESPDLLKALGLAAVGDAAVYRFALPAGAVVERRIAGEPPSAERPYSTPAQAMFPQRLPLEDARWRTALAYDAAPYALRDWPIRFRARPAPEIDGLVLELRNNMDANGFRIAQVLKDWDEQIARARPANLVLDLRVNDGGDLRTTRAFLQALPDRIPGKIFVLTSPFTFSAAVASAAYLEQAAPEKVIIVGEEVGDRLVFFAEGGGVTLPNSKGMIGMGTQRHDYAGGCRAYRDCHSSVVRDPIAVATLKPDIAAPWTIEAYLAGRDPAMEAVAKALRR